MHLLDWLVLAVPIALVLTAGIMTQRYMKSVAHFVAGGRVAGRYVLTVARGEMGAGAVVFVAIFEQIRQSGFTLTWWRWFEFPIILLFAIAGFVIYRYRETRVLTLAQFFEVRYSKSFRLFAGVLGFLAGILNFGIIPVVGSRFMVYILGLPTEVSVFSWTIPTYLLLMGLFLSLTVLVVTSGGFITIMVTDCLEGIFSQLAYLIIIAALLLLFSWNEMSQILVARDPGKSIVNPFDSLAGSDFNVWYVLMTMFLSIYGTMAWQNASAYNAAAINAHESRMATVLGRWREGGKMAVITLLAVGAMTYLQHPDFAVTSQSAHEMIGHIEDPKVQQQMEIPIAVSHLLPIGIKGLLCAILIMGILGGDSNHLHSWGNILIQDVIVPLRKRPLAPKQHIRLLRLSVIGVAIWAFIFGAFMKQTEYIYMWWAVTTGVFVGGAGAAIIGGLYWSRGTTAAAWTAMLAGSGLALGGILARQIWGDAFPFHGAKISLFASLAAIVLYIIVSLLTCREKFNLNRMLHREEYALDQQAESDARQNPYKPGWFGRMLTFDRNFTLSDKWIAGGLFGWGMLWFAVAAVGSLLNWYSPWPVAAWLTFWHIVGIGVPILVAFVTGIWFTWGGVRDIGRLFRHLKSQNVNDLDDGTVAGHHNLGEQIDGSRSPYPPESGLNERENQIHQKNRADQIFERG